MCLGPLCHCDDLSLWKAQTIVLTFSSCVDAFRQAAITSDEGIQTMIGTMATPTFVS